MQHVVYKATNSTNGKSYIGFTKNLAGRIRQHRFAARRGDRQHFPNALRKYGEQAFTWEVLCEAPTKAEAAKVETLLIAAFDTFENGYNSTTGGEGNYEYTPEVRQKMSAVMKGRTHKGTPCSEEKKKAISAANKGRTSWRKGKKASDLHKARMSATMKKVWQEKKRKQAQITTT